MDEKRDKESNHTEMLECEKSEKKKHRHRGKSSEKHLNKDIILKELNIISGQTILDAGCGNGYMSKEFSKLLNNTGKVYALDPDKTAIEILKEETKKTNIETIVGDITKRTQVDSHGLTPVALKKNELDNFSFGIHPRAHARGPLLISIVRRSL